MQQQYSIGFISHSRTQGEQRIPIWWEHLNSRHLNHPCVQEYLFEKNFFEKNFGLPIFRELVSDRLTQLGCQVVDRLDVLRLSDIVISLKPQDEWLYMKPNSTLIGWFSHLEFTPQPPPNVRLLNFEDIQINIQGKSQKILYENAYVAGECGVAQTLEILRKIAPGSPAVSSQPRLAVVLGYGNLGQGALAELVRQGIEKIIVFTQRSPQIVKNKLKDVVYRQMIHGLDNTYAANSQNSISPLMENILIDADIIVNATIPSSQQPMWTFIPWQKFSQLKRDMAYIDPVHRVGHGASFAHTTHLTEPVKQIHQLNHSIWYNGCNAMPSYRPTHASFVISQAITTYFDDLLQAVAAFKPELR